MIRIETTAEFDAEGRFTATGQSPTAVAPGPHRIVVLVDDPTSSEPTSVSDEPPLKWVDGLLVFTGEFLEDPEEVRRRLDDERMRELLGDLAE
jgi:hypothetical protein